MAAIALDTYAIAKQLRSAGFSEAQAEAVTDAVRQIRDSDQSTLATKADIVTLRADITELRAMTKSDLSEAKADLLKWIVGAIGLQAFAILGGIIALIRVLAPQA
jgi:malate/lactate dehydrogenase